MLFFIQKNFQKANSHKFHRSNEKKFEQDQNLEPFRSKSNFQYLNYYYFIE